MASTGTVNPDVDIVEEHTTNCSTCPNEASGFCQDCDKPFCSTCLPVHTTLLAGHTVLGSEKRSEWGKKKEKIWTRECKEHAGQVTCMFCSSHDIVCCPVCAVQKHNNLICFGKILYIPDIPKGFSGSQENRQQTDLIDNILAGLSDAEHKLRDQATHVQDAKDQADVAMKDLQTRVGTLLNTLEETSRKKIRMCEEFLEKADEIDLATCVAYSQEVTEMKKALCEAENADDIDIRSFLCAQTNRKTIEKLHIFLYALAEKSDMQIKFSIDNNVQRAVDLLEKAESFGVLQKMEAYEQERAPVVQQKEKDPSQTGTWIKFIPPIGEDTVVQHGVCKPINTQHQCITAMEEYEDKTLEELRLEDYAANRKVKQASDTATKKDSATDKDSPTQKLSWNLSASAFGTLASQMSGFSIGQPASTEAPTASPRGIFGQKTTTAAAASGFPLGSRASTVAPTTVYGNPFGKPASTTATPAAFPVGSAATTVAATTVSGGFFGQPATTTAAESGNSFGSPASTVAATTVSGGFFGQPATTTVVSGNSFMPMAFKVDSTTDSGDFVGKPETTTAAASGFSEGDVKTENLAV